MRPSAAAAAGIAKMRVGAMAVADEAALREATRIVKTRVKATVASVVADVEYPGTENLATLGVDHQHPTARWDGPVVVVVAAAVKRVASECP
jgi:hypothetical protein